MGWPGALRGKARCSCCRAGRLAAEGELQYRLLWYPQRAYFVVLMGSERDTARYLGCLDANWHVVHHVELAGGGLTGERGDRQECLFYLSPRARHAA